MISFICCPGNMNLDLCPFASCFKNNSTVFPNCQTVCQKGTKNCRKTQFLKILRSVTGPLNRPLKGSCPEKYLQAFDTCDRLKQFQHQGAETETQNHELSRAAISLQFQQRLFSKKTCIPSVNSARSISARPPEGRPVRRHVGIQKNTCTMPLRSF